MRVVTCLQILLISTAISILNGCQKFEGYNFSSPEKHFDFGRVRAKLYGEKKDYLFYAKQAEPYQLIIRFDFSLKRDAKIDVNLLELESSTTGRIEYKTNDFSILYDSSKKEQYVYYIVDNVLDKYQETVLKIKFKVYQSNTVSEYSVQIPFTKDYKEFWQTLLSA